MESASAADASNGSRPVGQGGLGGKALAVPRLKKAYEKVSEMSPYGLVFALYRRKGALYRE